MCLNQLHVSPQPAPAAANIATQIIWHLIIVFTSQFGHLNYCSLLSQATGAQEFSRLQKLLVTSIAENPTQSFLSIGPKFLPRICCPLYLPSKYLSFGHGIQQRICGPQLLHRSLFSSRSLVCGSGVAQQRQCISKPSTDIFGCMKGAQKFYFLLFVFLSLDYQKIIIQGVFLLAPP